MWKNTDVVKNIGGKDRTTQQLTRLFSCWYILRVVIPREERGIEEFNGEEFLARKSGEENEELTGLNKDLFRGKTRELSKKIQEKLKKI